MVRASLLVLLAAPLFASAARSSLRAAKEEVDQLQPGAGASKSKTLAAPEAAPVVAAAAPVASGNLFDGYSRYGCEQDIAPQAQRIYFKEHACGEVKSCRLTELGMTPRLCFDFCRAQASAKFFGIEHGRDCYCGTYIHPHSTGGGGCDLSCEGDNKEMCGGKAKSSVFEMHACGDSMSEGESAQQLGEEAASKCREVGGEAATSVGAARDLAMKWTKLDFCSTGVEGKRVCALSDAWTAGAAALAKVAAESDHAGEVVEKDLETLGQAMANAEGNDDPKLASALELSTEAARKEAIKAKGIVAVTALALKHQAGPLAGGAALDNFKDVFHALGDVDGGFDALCGLVAIEGESYVAQGSDDPSVCGNHCLGLSTGVGACVGFNFQHGEGVAACQLLKAEGLKEPKDSLSMAVPIFEVSNTKRAAMGFDAMGCYVHGAFLAGHKKGPLKTQVVTAATVD